MKETLFISPDLCATVWFLKDARGACLGSFASAEAAEKWCREFGYRSRRV